MGYVYYLCSMKVRAIQLLRKIINIMKKLTQEQEQETNAIIAGIKAAFSETYKGSYQYQYKNDAGVSIDEVLELKGFKKRIEEKVEDIVKITDYGVMSKPALVVEGVVS